MLLRTIPGMEDYMKPLDKIVNDKFLPVFLGSTLTQAERELFSLPIKLGGLGIPIFAEKAGIDYETSKNIIPHR